jgi:hypothetical protein
MQRIPISTQITPLHRDKLVELTTDGGMRLNGVIEQGIDAVYDKMLEANLIQGVAVGPAKAEDTGAVAGSETGQRSG